MSSVQVRPFRRDDRDQLTQLVNAHAEAVVPGMSASVNAVLSSLGRRTSPGSTGKPGTPTPGTPRSSTWPGSRICPARPGRHWPG